jgi:phosphoribosylaminoimidazolecarboxamide formyltransferase / IMP cyclohydrolase
VIKLRLKYGCNPDQVPAYASFPDEMGFEVHNGEPSWINILDAINAWRLVSDLKSLTGKECATSFKHLSPAGAAVSGPLAPSMAHSSPRELSPIASAYIRARGGDQMSSFGDAVAVSGEVDRTLAEVLRREVSDLIIAPSYTPPALKILSEKKNGQYLVLQVSKDYTPAPVESFRIYGVELEQPQDRLAALRKCMNAVTDKGVEPDIAETMAVAITAAQYATSNSVALAYRGQIIGIGAGQQSRIHCTRLACDKAEKWLLQQHPRMVDMKFRPGIPRAERIVFADQFLLYDSLNQHELTQLHDAIPDCPPPLTRAERLEWFSEFSGICLASDGFFPFRDNIDRAAQTKVGFILHPGGSVRGADIQSAAAQHGIQLIETGVRLFKH